MKARLSLNQLKFEMFLGVYAHEKKVKQSLLVNISLDLLKVPKGCFSDNLEGTICYDKLIAYLRERVQIKHFDLIEHFAWFLFKSISEYIQMPADISVEVLKNPHIEGLSSASFILKGSSKCQGFS